MKKLLLALVILLSVSTYANAAKELVIEFSYEPVNTAYNATAYKVYANDTMVCTTSVPTVNPGELQCDASALPPRTYAWTITAVYASGEESPHSVAYNFEILPDPTAPNIITIRFK